MTLLKIIMILSNVSESTRQTMSLSMISIQFKMSFVIVLPIFITIGIALVVSPLVFIE